MVFEVTKEQLITLQRRAKPPHVVILGAGASLAAFSNGDRNGRRLPLMKNIVEVIGLQDEVSGIYHDLHNDFEALYSRLYSDDPKAEVARKIEQRIEDYFSKLELPKHATLYDFLLLSLREKDAVFTFNWDPFLFDAYKRLKDVAPLPAIYHLHGNVRVGVCGNCGRSGERGQPCSACGNTLNPTRLLYPVEQKNYAEDTFIESQWKLVEEKLSEAWYVTIFGYSAPKTDQEAIRLFTNAWKGEGEDKKLIERVEIIDIRDQSELFSQWWDFAHFDHIDVRRSFFESVLARYPRRTCEAHGYMGIDGQFVEPIPWPGNLEGLKNSVAELAAYERDS
jgi:hypothetical protein